MDHTEFRKTIKKLGLNQVEAGKFLGVTDRTARYWASGKMIPNAVAIALSLMVKFKITPDQALKIAKRDDWYDNSDDD